MIKCPCGKEVEQTLVYGIKVYKHKDGTFCDYLNEFSTNVDDVLYQYRKDYEEQIFKINAKVRRRKYYQISKIKDEEKLKQTLKDMYDSGNMYVSEMKEIFGRNFMQNLEESIGVIITNQQDLLAVSKEDLKRNMTDDIVKDRLKMKTIKKRVIETEDVMKALRNKVSRIKGNLSKKFGG